MIIKQIIKQLIPDNLSIKQLLKMLALFGAFLLIGLFGLNEYKSQDQYTDYRDHIILHGTDARITVYGVAAVCSIMIIYTLILLLVALYREKQDKKQKMKSKP
jgi:uncharacterized membrane protein